MGRSIFEETCEPVLLDHHTCFTDLPNDSLYLIFEKLNDKEDQNSFGRTCHCFLNIQNSSRKCLKACGYLSPNSIAKLLSRFRQLESLFLTSCHGVLYSGLRKLQMYGSRLHSLDLSLCYKVTDKSIVAFASGCPSLSVISLYHCSSITDNGLKILTRFCTSLKRVDLTFCFKISYHGILYLNQNCRQLRALRIAGHAFKGFYPTFLKEGGSLECLHFTSPMIGPWGHELSIIGLGFAANLKILNFHEVTLVNDEIVLQIAKGCPLLTEWNLTHCCNITTSGWNSIGLHCQNLEILHATATSLSETGEGLVAVGNGCRRLSVIYMKTIFYFAPNWMHSFTTQRPNVKIINKEATQINHSWAFIT